MRTWFITVGNYTLPHSTFVAFLRPIQVMLQLHSTFLNDIIVHRGLAKDICCTIPDNSSDMVRGIAHIINLGVQECMTTAQVKVTNIPGLLTQ